MIGTYTHNGHVLNALLVPSVIYLIDRLWSDEREQIKRTLDDAGVGPDVRLKTLQDHDRLRGMGEILARYAFTYKGATEIISAAIKESNIDITVADLGLDMTEQINKVALNLLGIDWDELTAKRKDQDKEPDPTQAVPVTG